MLPLDNEQHGASHYLVPGFYIYNLPENRYNNTYNYLKVSDFMPGFGSKYRVNPLFTM